MATITNPNWYDLNADRAYPLLDSATKTSTDGSFVLPDDLIVDLRISAPSSLDPTDFYISRIQAFGTGFLVFIAAGGGDVALATAASVQGEEYQAFRITPLPGSSVSGTVVFGGASTILAAGVSTHDFTASATPIVPTLILPSQGGVASLTIRDSLGVETRLVGDVILTEGPNADLSITGQEIAVGMTSGVVIDPCDCDDPGGASRPPIRTINGVGPDGDGDLSIVVDGCPDLSPVTNGLRLVDRCAQPCCGDEELRALLNSIQDIDRFLADLARRASQLEGGVRDVEAWLVQ